jgi:hypothetical protein
VAASSDSSVTGGRGSEGAPPSGAARGLCLARFPSRHVGRGHVDHLRQHLGRPDRSRDNVSTPAPQGAGAPQLDLKVEARYGRPDPFHALWVGSNAAVTRAILGSCRENVTYHLHGGGRSLQAGIWLAVDARACPLPRLAPAVRQKSPLLHFSRRVALSFFTDA